MALTFKRVAEHLYRASNDTYYCILNRNGVTKRVSLKTTDRFTASQRLAEQMKKVSRIRHSTGAVTFADLSEEWKTIILPSKNLKPSSIIDRKYNLLAIERAWPTLNVTPVRQITPTDCQKWAINRRKIVSPHRFNNELGTLRLIFKLALKKGIIGEDPSHEIERCDIPRSRVVVPTREEFTAIIQHIRGRNNGESADLLTPRLSPLRSPSEKQFPII